MNRSARTLGVLILSTLMLAGCGPFAPRGPAPVDTGRPLPATPPAPGAPGEPLSRYGNPEFYVVDGVRYVPLKSAEGYVERGVASWYGPDFHGGLTSTREAYDMYQMSGAHKTLPLPCWVEVTNLENGRKARLRINDRGPFKKNRVIDLSYAAALKLDIVKQGTAFVEVRAVAGPAAPPLRVAEVAPAAPAGVAAAPPRMYLQVGAFGDRANADRLRQTLAPTVGSEVRVYEDTSHAPPLYKVQLGPVRDVTHADQLVSALAAVGIASHHFVNQ